jgi:hypothetical protein
MLESAPSLPPGAGSQASQAAVVKQHLEQAAGALGGLAATLGETLGQAAVEAADAGDRAALQDAAVEVRRVAELLSSDHR